MKAPLLLAAACFSFATLATAQPTARPAVTAIPSTVAATSARVTSNPNFRLVERLEQQFRNNVWLDTVRYTYSRFNSANLAMRELRENAPTRGAALRPLRQERYQYNTANQRVSDSTITYTAGTLNNYPTRVVRYTYNAQGRLQQEQVNIRFGGNLVPYARTTYTYNAQGQNTILLDEGYIGNATSGSWFASSRDLFTYNAQGLLATDEFQTADLAGTTFSMVALDTYSYNAAGLLSSIVSQSIPPSGTTLQNQRRQTYTYDAATPARLQQTVIDFWQNNAWRPAGAFTNTYDADNNLTEELGQQYQGTTLVNYYRTRFTYQRNPLAITAANSLKAGLHVAPNPGHAGVPTTLRYALPVAAPVTVTVLDALGRPTTTVAAGLQAAGPHTLALPATSLAAGLYFVRLTAGLQSQTVKLVVE